MPDIATHRYGGYENLNLTQAQIASRAYNAGLPPTIRPVNAYHNLTFKPVRVMLGTVPTEYGVDIDAAGSVQWRNPSGVVTVGGTGFAGYVLFCLAGSIGVGAYNSISGDTKVCYAAGTWLTLPLQTGRHLKAQEIEHNDWKSTFGANY
jgi:hypothetical protein